MATVGQRWGLTAGPPFEPGGETAWVAPVRSTAGLDQVLKLAWRHPEAEHKADPLQVWDGNGAVLVHETAQLEDTIVLLLERCRPGTALSGRPESEQDEIIDDLLPRLWVNPPDGHRFRPLQQMCEEWADQFEQQLQACSDGPPLDPGLTRLGVSMLRSLPASAERSVLLGTDIHAGNVLALDGSRGW